MRTLNKYEVRLRNAIVVAAALRLFGKRRHLPLVTASAKRMLAAVLVLALDCCGGDFADVLLAPGACSWATVFRQMKRLARA